MSRYAITANCANFATISHVIHTAVQADAMAKKERADSGVVLIGAKVPAPISPECAP